MGQPINNTRVEMYTNGRAFNSDANMEEDKEDNEEGEGRICRDVIEIGFWGENRRGRESTSDRYRRFCSTSYRKLSRNRKSHKMTSKESGTLRYDSTEVNKKGGSIMTLQGFAFL